VDNSRGLGSQTFSSLLTTLLTLLMRWKMI